MVHATPAARRWAAIIDEQEASGQTIRAFAEARDINVKTLSWWRCRLGRSRPLRRAANPAPVPVFEEIRVTDEPVDRTVVVVFDRLPAHIVVDHDTDLELLRRVLEAAC